MSRLSLPLENTAIMRVPFSILARMYQRASLILARNEENIHPNPRRVDNLPVMWQTRQLMLHHMQFAGNVPCDMEHIICAAPLASILKLMSFVLIL